MLDIDLWLEEISKKLKSEFGTNLLFLGYQGSYRRGEATDKSDIDMVVILESLGLAELERYKQIVQSMPEKEKACGFISGRKELYNWSKYELFQLYNDTKPLYGDMKNLIPEITHEDSKEAVKTGSQNIFHAACHSYIYDESPKEALKGLFKAVFFVLQAKYFCEHKEYVLTKSELLKEISGKDKELLNLSINKNEINSFNEEETKAAFELLIDFCSDNILEY